MWIFHFDSSTNLNWLKFLVWFCFVISFSICPRTDRLNAALKLVLLFIALPVLIALWLLFGIVGIILVGVGYGVFTPWISTLEAFRQSCNQEKFLHCITVSSTEYGLFFLFFFLSFFLLPLEPTFQNRNETEGVNCIGWNMGNYQREYNRGSWFCRCLLSFIPTLS